VAYAWDFTGDGVPDREGTKVTWTFPAEGEYAVTLTVTDDGTKTISKDTLRVTLSPEPVEAQRVWAVVVGVSEHRDSSWKGRSTSGRTLTWRGRSSFAAAKEEQRSYENPELGQGVFTHFLLQGLRGQADENQDGKVTVQEVYAYVSREVPKYVREKVGAEQHPPLTRSREPTR